MKEEPINSPQDNDNISDSDIIFDLLQPCINLHAFRAKLFPSMFMGSVSNSQVPGYLTNFNSLIIPSIITAFAEAEQNCIAYCDTVAKEHGFIITSPAYLTARDKFIKTLFVINLEHYKDMGRFVNHHMLFERSKSNQNCSTQQNVSCLTSDEQKRMNGLINHFSEHLKTQKPSSEN